MKQHSSTKNANALNGVSREKSNPIQRKLDILEHLQLQDTATAQGLAETLGVSVMTIRRDLNQLEDEGLIDKQHGAVIMANRFSFPKKHGERSHHKAEAKEKIGAFAATHLVDNKEDSLIVDSGSTTLAFVKSLADSPINIMVNSLPALAHLSTHQQTQVYSLGGKFNQDVMAFEGTIAGDIIKDCHFSKAFLGTDGIDLQAGFTTSNTANAQLTRLMAAQAIEVYILTDLSKFHQRAFATIMRFEHITGIVSEAGVPEQYKDVFKKHNIKLYEVE